MAVLTTEDLIAIRQSCSKGGIVNYTKAQINTVSQEVEDWFEANKASLNTAINNSSGAFTFSASQKKQIVKYWLLGKFGRE